MNKEPIFQYIIPNSLSAEEVCGRPQITPGHRNEVEAAGSFSPSCKLEQVRNQSTTQIYIQKVSTEQTLIYAYMIIINDQNSSD